MKQRLLLTGIMLTAGLAGGSTLRPSVIVHGEIRDPYGILLHSGAQVSALLGTNEVARTVVGEYPNGLSYRLPLDVHDPITGSPDQVTPNSLVTIQVKQGATDQPLIGSSTFPAPGNGASVRANFILGEDTDQDGLPDAWENVVIANSGGAAATLSDVGPGKDVDGDGMNDDQEFWYGSFAFLPGDELRVDDLDITNGRYALTLLTVVGAVYTVESTTDLALPAWGPCSISMTETGSPAPVQFEGNGGFITVYIEPSEDARYRLTAKQ